MDAIPMDAAGAPDGSILRGAQADAERWLAAWLHDGAASGRPAEVRDLNAAITALRRLIDSRNALRELEEEEEEVRDERETQDALRVLQRRMADADGGDDPRDDEDPFPDGP